MATTRSGDAPADSGAAPVGDKPKAAKLEEGFKPNEPSHKSGIDADGKADDSLSPKQQERAATEALTSLRPQPSGEEIKSTLNALNEVDEKGQPKNKSKTAKEAGDKAVAELNKQRGG